MQIMQRHGVYDSKILLPEIPEVAVGRHYQKQIVIYLDDIAASYQVVSGFLLKIKPVGPHLSCHRRVYCGGQRRYLTDKIIDVVPCNRRAKSFSEKIDKILLASVTHPPG